MGSESREVRDAQKARVEKALEARLGALAARGLEKKTIDKDPTVRELRADLKQARKRIAAIDAREAQARELAEHKAQKAAEAKEPKKKGKKEEAAAEPAESKKKKKKAEKAEKAAAGAAE